MEMCNSIKGESPKILNYDFDRNSAGVSVQRESQSILVECWQNEYAEHFLQTLREKEAKRPVTTLSSPQLKYRGFLILKMRRVASRLALGGRVLHAGVRLLDIFMDGYAVSEDRLLHVALICLLIATKFEVKGVRVPRFSEFCDEADSTDLSHSELWSLEWNVLQHMRWDLCTPTAATFVEFYTPLAVNKEDYDEWCLKGNQLNVPFDRFKLLVKNRIKMFLHFTLSDMRLTKFAPSLVAAACLQAARNLFGLPYWPPLLQKLTTHQQASVDPIAILLYKMMMVKDGGRRRHYSDSTDDQGYCTAKSSPESKTKKSRNAYDS